MSKSNLGRCAAVGIAGLTAMTSMASIAMVASAEAYPSYVYEFQYGGIETTQVYHKAIDAVADNDYFKYANQTAAQAVFNAATGFKSTDLSTAFWGDIDTAYNAAYGYPYNCVNRSTDYWQYAIATSFSAAVVPVYVEESYNERAGSSTNMKSNYAFKSVSERDAAMSAIATKNKTNYTTKYNAASSALSKDLNDAINAYRNAQNALIKKAQDEVNAAFRDPNNTQVIISSISVFTSLDDTKGHVIDRTEDRNNPDNTLTLSEWVALQNTKTNDTVKALTAVATQAKNEFREAYQVTNWAFDYDVSKDRYATTADAVPFKSADGPVTFGGSIGSYIDYSTANYTTLSTQTLNLSEDYYRTVGQYVDADNYAFSGEILLSADRIGAGGNINKIKSLLLDSDRWSKFSVLIDGKPTDNGNTSESGSSSNTTTDNTTTTATTWYPDSASYRAASEVSYKGNNGSWYTSSSAASIYGGGYSGVSKSSNYSSVNSNAGGKTIYFDSTSGTYSTSSSSYSYVVKEGTGTSDSSNDPYYSHIWGGTTNNTTTTVPAGSPAISGASKYAGWTNISAYITNRAKSGSTYSINMNDESIVPASVLAAAKAKNVTLTFVNDNGSKVTVKPGKVSTTSDLKVSVTYNVKDVKSSLVAKAKKVNPGTVSTAQVRIGNDGSIGGTATVNVKFSTKRSGCTVKAYRLTASGSLVKEASGTVASTGRVNLNLTKGGSYLLVVID